MTEVIRNGLYSITTTLLDGARRSNGRLGAARRQNAWGGSVLYHVGTYQCFDSNKWKGEVTSREHSPTIEVRPFAGYVAGMGFAGTYTSERAEFEATALVGKRSIRLRTVFRLLIADCENSPPSSG
jgi:hypothetical protein